MSDLFVGAFIGGSLSGFVPMVLGMHRGEERLGSVAMLLCIVASLMLGVFLAIPVAALFAIIILRRTRNGRS
jgi:uncharacterized membrane protein YraQ (UPF0718 family)